MKTRIIATLIAITLIIPVLTSCSSKLIETTEQPIEATTTKDPIESLGEYERRIFDVLMQNIGKFNNPQSVRILEVRGFDFFCYHVKVSCSNKLGATVTATISLGVIKDTDTLADDYKEIYGKAGEYGTLMKVTDEQWEIDEMTSECDIDVASLNNAISYYWESKGL